MLFGGIVVRINLLETEPKVHQNVASETKARIFLIIFVVCGLLAILARI